MWAWRLAISIELNGRKLAPNLDPSRSDRLPQIMRGVCPLSGPQPFLTGSGRWPDMLVDNEYVTCQGEIDSEATNNTFPSRVTRNVARNKPDSICLIQENLPLIIDRSKR
jgi:hypothetical protein